MQNKPYFFFGNRGSQKGGGSDTWEKFPKNPVFFWERPLVARFVSIFASLVALPIIPVTQSVGCGFEKA